MTVPSSRSAISDSAPAAASIIILGTDALVAALPATPVQLAHACLRAGFANVIPASWGDELIAAAVLDRLPAFGAGPAIQCSCPIVAHRLLTTGGDLRPVLLPLASPPVAAARYVRTLLGKAGVRITYAGNCPGAADESIDVRVSPLALIAMLAERSIALRDQPRVFESIIPSDRRRFHSQPGGVPTADALWMEHGSRALVEVSGDDYVAEIAQLLLSGKRVLIDATSRLGCACSGAADGVNRRAEIAQLEPPRSSTPIVEDHRALDLDMPVPAASRTPVDVVAVPSTPRSSYTVTPPHAVDPPFGNRLSPVRAGESIPEPRQPRMSGPITPRSILSALPVARAAEGRSLPRAYIARRRSSPRGISVVTPPEVLAPLLPSPMRLDAVAAMVTDAPESSTLSAVLTPPGSIPAQVPSRPVDVAALRSVQLPQPHANTHRSTGITRGQLVGILLGVVLVAICASTVIGVIVGRSINTPSIGASIGR